MNPLYYTAQQEGIDYLAGFVTHLHKVARFVIVQVYDLMKHSTEEVFSPGLGDLGKNKEKIPQSPNPG
jgi:hypothetical protein